MIVGSAPPMPCGIGDNTIALVKHLAERGHSIHLITSTQACSVPQINGVDVHPVMRGWSSLHGGLLLKNILDIQPDIVHVQYPSRGYGKGFAPNIIGMQLKARRYHAPFIVTLHEFSFAHPLRKAAIMPLLSEATAIIMPSVQERDALFKRFGTLAKIPSHVIPIGAVLPDGFDGLKDNLYVRRDELLRKWNAHSDRIVVNYGFIQPHKGIELILKSVKKLVEDGLDCEFWQVGNFNPEKQRYHRYLKFLSEEQTLRSRIRFLGYMPLETAAEIFTVARVGVFPFTDGYSDRRSSMITFSHFDVPMLPTKSSIDEVDDKIKPYVTLIERNNVQQLTESLKVMLFNEATYRNEKERVKGFKNLYDWRMIAEKTELVYRQYLR